MSVISNVYRQPFLNQSYHVEDIVQTTHPLAFLGIKASHSEDDGGICPQLVSLHYWFTLEMLVANGLTYKLLPPQFPPIPA